MLKENYKQKREELNDILIELDVPKIHWYNLQFLNSVVSRLKESDSRNNAIKLIHEISPIQLTRIIKNKEIYANSL